MLKNDSAIRTARRPVRRAGYLMAGVLMAVGLSACSEADAEEPGGDSVGDPELLTVTDPWVVAEDEGMTSGFGVLVNHTDEDLVVIEARSPLSPEMELHEVIIDDSGAAAMQEKDEGFTVPAGGEHVLEPGGDHVMFMDLVEPINPGDQVELTLVIAGGDEVVLEAQARSFTGGEEEYIDHSDHGDHSDHDGDADHGDHDDQHDSDGGDDD